MRINLNKHFLYTNASPTIQGDRGELRPRHGHHVGAKKLLFSPSTLFAPCDRGTIGSLESKNWKYRNARTALGELVKKFPQVRRQQSGSASGARKHSGICRAGERLERDEVPNRKKSNKTRQRRTIASSTHASGKSKAIATSYPIAPVRSPASIFGLSCRCGGPRLSGRRQASVRRAERRYRRGVRPPGHRSKVLGRRQSASQSVRH